MSPALLLSAAGAAVVLALAFWPLHRRPARFAAIAAVAGVEAVACVAAWAASGNRWALLCAWIWAAGVVIAAAGAFELRRIDRHRAEMDRLSGKTRQDHVRPLDDRGNGHRPNPHT